MNTGFADILELATPRCFFGDEFLAGVQVSQVHLLVSGVDDRGLFAELRQRIGDNVTVVATKAFGANSGHHHAPVLLVLRNVSNRAAANETGMTTVEAFYLALAAGDGSGAARYIIPAKRRSCTFSPQTQCRLFTEV